MELVLLRHGQPCWTSETGCGVRDPGLTELGRERCRALRSLLDKEEFESIIVSPYRRCQETAAEALGERQFETANWLREISLPDFSATPAAEVYEFFANAKKRPLSGWWQGAEGGESFRAFHQRVSKGLLGYLAELGVRRPRPGCDLDHHLFQIPDELLGQKHLFVGHLGTSGLILSELLHLELVPWVWESFCLDWNGIIRIETSRVADAHIFCLRAFNEGGHRDPSLGNKI